MDIIQKYKYHFSLLLIAILAFWQIVFFVHPVKFDIVDYNYPFRYFIGECLQHGKLPLWNPYQNLGYPIHADPSSGAWYPIVWIIGYISGYTLYTLGIELVFHIFLAGIGFYTLSKTLKLVDNTAFVAGFSYMLCGIFIGNAQHLSFVISACWLPFVLNYYFKMVEGSGYINSLKASLFLYLMITGGYPAFTIILFYLLLVLFCYFTITYVVAKEKAKLVLLLKQHLFVLITTLLLSSVMLISIYEVLPFITRTNQFAFSNALIGPFSPQSTISFLLPYASIKDPEFFATDPSMTNAYFGIILFLFFLCALFIKKPAQYKILFGFAFFSLLAAFGAYLPVRTFLFDYIPMMNLFRIPSVFRLFVIVGFLSIAAFGFDLFDKQEFEKQKKYLLRLSVFFILFFISTIIYLLYNNNLELWEFIENDLFVYSKTSTIIQHIAFQSILQIGVLLLFIIIVLKISDKDKARKLITLLIVIDLTVSAQLNEPYTAYYDMFSAKESHEHMKKFPQGFPQLKDITIAEVKADTLYFGPFWKNLNVFQKQISRDGYNPFCLTGYEKLRDSTPQLFSEITKNKIAFLSDKVFEETGIPRFKKDSAFTNKTLFFKTEDIKQFNNIHFEANLGDTAQLIYFAPDSFIIEAETKQTQLLTLLQNNYIGWEASINSEKVPLYTSNGTLISAIVPPGKNTIRFIYKNDKIKYAFYVSLISLILCLLILLKSIRKGSKEEMEC